MKHNHEPIYTLYHGAVFRDVHGCWVAEFGKKRTYFGKRKGFKTDFDAFMGAKEFQQVTSDSMGLTEIAFPSDLALEQKSYFAGFIDGDGCIAVTKPGSIRVRGNQSQSHGIPDVLQALKQAYGGTFAINHNRTRFYPKRRKCYKWGLDGIDALPAIKDVAEHALLKANQAQEIFNFVTTYDTHLCSQIYDKLHQMKSLDSYRQVKMKNERLNLPYIAGFFDAEGCIQIAAKASVSIVFAQKSSLALLEAINAFFQNSGTVFQNGALIFCGCHAENVLKAILPHLIVKKDQAVLALEAFTYARVNYRYRDSKMLKRMAFIRQRVKELKKL